MLVEIRCNFKYSIYDDETKVSYYMKESVNGCNFKIYVDDNDDYGLNNARDELLESVYNTMSEFNRQITEFETIATPLIFLDEKDFIHNLNFEQRIQYYRERDKMRKVGK